MSRPKRGRELENQSFIQKLIGFPEEKSGWPITTSDVNIGGNLTNFATDRNVDLFHGTVEMSDTKYGKVRVEDIRNLNPSGNNIPLKSPNGNWVNL